VVGETRQASPTKLDLSQIPWTIMDLVKGTGVAIGILVIIAIAMAIGTVAIIGPDTLQGLDVSDFTEMFAILKSQGVLNAWLILLFAVMVLGEGAMPLSAWLFSARKYRSGWRSLGFRRFDMKKGLLLAAAIVCLGLLIGYFYDLLLEHAFNRTPSDMYTPFTNSGLGMATLAVAVAIVAPLAEETFFRGFLFPAIGRRYGLVWGIVVSGALFAIPHLGGQVPAFILGILLAWLYWKTGSLWPCILTHFAYNSLVLIFMVI
jgi:membrane protease YdiL (CAAX protease family)